MFPPASEERIRPPVKFLLIVSYLLIEHLQMSCIRRLVKIRTGIPEVFHRDIISERVTSKIKHCSL